MFAVVRQYGVVVLETQKFYASLLLLILQLQMLSGALLKSRKLTLLQTTMVVFTMKLLLNLSVYIRELLVLETCPYIRVFIGASPTVWWLIELKRNALWCVRCTYVHGTFSTVIYYKSYRLFASHRLF